MNQLTETTRLSTIAPKSIGMNSERDLQQFKHLKLTSTQALKFIQVFVMELNGKIYVEHKSRNLIQVMIEILGHKPLTLSLF